MKNTNHIVILVGICGTGKSIVAQKLSQRLDLPYFNVDSLFMPRDWPQGTLPQEVDLENWLTAVEGLIEKETTRKGCVISCSILKKEHRIRLTNTINHQLDWIFMNDTYQNVAQRLEKQGTLERPVSAVKSDFETLEVPKRALTIDMSYSQQETVDTILKYLARKYG